MLGGIYLGDRGRDGHVSRQEEGEDGSVANHGRAARERHEVVPGVGILQDGVCSLLAVLGRYGLDCSLPQCI